MKIQWCWRCKMDIPMLDDNEFASIRSQVRERGGQALLDGYEQLTGFKETNWSAVAHHLISLHGPPCPRCGKVLRTPTSAKCFECGYSTDQR